MRALTALAAALFSILVLAGAPLQAQTSPPTQYTVQGNLGGISTTTGDLLQVRFTLVNCGTANPVVPGVTSVVTKLKVFTAAADGTFSGALWGNDQISCNMGTTTGYQVCYLRNNVPTGSCAVYRVTAQTATSGLFDLTSAQPTIILPPINLAASGVTCPNGQVMTGIQEDWTPICGTATGTSGTIANYQDVQNNHTTLTPRQYLNANAATGITATDDPANSSTNISLANIPNSALTHSSITINGVATPLGGSINVAGGSSGPVTGTTANGFTVSVDTSTSTPAIAVGVDSTHVLPITTGSSTLYLNGAGQYTTPALPITSFQGRLAQAAVLTPTDVANLGQLSNSISGNAATASALNHTPATCSAGYAPTGIMPNGDATGCQTFSGSGGAAAAGATYAIQFNAGTGALGGVSFNGIPALSTSGPPAAATYAQVVQAWGNGCTGFLKSDGTCAASTAPGQTGPQYALPCFNGSGSGGAYALGPCAGLTSDANGTGLHASASFSAATVSARGDIFDPQGTTYPNFKFPSNYSAGGYLSGFGRNQGNAGGWWKGAAFDHNVTVLKSGIYQTYTCALNKNSDGDSSCAYVYNNCDGGLTGQSDEGCNGVNIQVRQTLYWMGHVRTYDAPTFQTGTLTAPVATAVPVEPSNGQHYNITVGAALLRSKTCTDTSHNTCTDAASYTGTLTAVSAPGSIGCSAVGYLQAIPVSGVSASLPTLTAWGCGGVTLPNNGQNDGTPTTGNLTIPLGTGVFHVGLAWIAGPLFPEPVYITAVNAAAGGTQSLTLTYSNPHETGIILVQDAAGLVGQYLTADADINYEPNPVPIFGSLTGNELYIGLNVWSSVIGTTYPVQAAPAYCALATPTACTSGPNGTGTPLTTGFHVYQGAPVIGSLNEGNPGWLDPYLAWNAVPWAATDYLTEPQNAAFGGQGFGVLWQHNTPHADGKDDTPVHIVAGGPGFAAEPGIEMQNSNAIGQYQGNGGALPPVEAMRIIGPFTSNFIDADTTPGYGAAIMQFNNWGLTLGQTGQQVYLFKAPGAQISVQPDTGVFGFSGEITATTVTASGGVNTSVVNTDFGLKVNFHSPAATCTPGQFQLDATQFWVCTATNTWTATPYGSSTGGGGTTTTGASSVGASGEIQASNGSGGFVDIGCSDVGGGNITCGTATVEGVDNGYTRYSGTGNGVWAIGSDSSSSNTPSVVLNGTGAAAGSGSIWFQTFSGFYNAPGMVIGGNTAGGFIDLGAYRAIRGQNTADIALQTNGSASATPTTRIAITGGVDTARVSIQNAILNLPLSTPASSSAPCTTGDYTHDANFEYDCVATNTWKRLALSTDSW